MAKKLTSAERRFKKSEARRMRNKMVKSRCKTSVKHFMKAIEDKDQAEATERYRLLQKELDKARSKGVLKRNTAARKKSRMAKLFNKTFAAPPQAAEQSAQ